MALQLQQKSIFGGLRFERTGIFRTDIFKFPEINLITASGVPVGQWPIGSMFFNSADNLLYVSTNYKANNLPSVAWYKLNGNITDFSGNANGITLTGGNYITGFYGKGLEIDGVNDKVEIEAQAFTQNNYDITWGFYLKLPTDWANGDTAYIYERYVNAINYITISIEGNGADNGQFRVRRRRGAAGTDNTLITEEIIPGSFIACYFRLSGTTSQVGVGAVGEQINYAWSSTAYTNETEDIGYSQLDSSFGNQDIQIDELKIWSPRKTPGTLDKINLDKNHWRTYSGSFAVAV